MYLTIYDLKKELDKTPPTGVTTVSNILYRKVLSSLLRTQTAARSLAYRVSRCKLFERAKGPGKFEGVSPD